MRKARIPTRSKFRKRRYLGDKLSAETFIPRPATAAGAASLVLLTPGDVLRKNGASLEHAPRDRVLMILKHLRILPRRRDYVGFAFLNISLRENVKLPLDSYVL